MVLWCFLCYFRSYRPSKTGLHSDLFKILEAISREPFAVGVNRCHHRLLGTIEPYRQIFIKIKNGRVSKLTLHLSICRGMPQNNNNNNDWGFTSHKLLRPFRDGASSGGPFICHMRSTLTSGRDRTCNPRVTIPNAWPLGHHARTSPNFYKFNISFIT